MIRREAENFGPANEGHGPSRSGLSQERSSDASPDEQLQAEVLAAFHRSGDVQPTEVGVEVDLGVVTLSGTVGNYHKKLAAEELALAVLGVRGVANDIVVHVPALLERTDTEIVLSVLKALDWSVSGGERRVKVAVSHGVVTIQGTVDTHHEKLAAETAIREIPGVHDLRNRLTVVDKTSE